MDILISSNLERLIYRIAGNSEAADRELMQDLAKDGKYEITDAMKKRAGRLLRQLLHPNRRQQTRLQNCTAIPDM